jgi:urea transport system substrate-binding protein
MTDSEKTLGDGDFRPATTAKNDIRLDRTIVGTDTANVSSETDAAGAQGSAESGGLGSQKWLNRRLGKYLVTGILGEGGMGVVLRALDETIEREVAIKVLNRKLSGDDIALQRFLLEARSAGQLSHSHTITIFEVGEHEGQYYLVLELVAGGSAADRLEQQGAYSVIEATRIAKQACEGLAAAHEHGLVHRDIKPANLLLSKTNIVKIADFGLAKQSLATSKHVTQAGEVVGTPYFMSPEQCESRPIDHRSDLYSLGATYYSLLTGRFPYQEIETVFKVMYAHCTAAPPDPRVFEPAIPQACASVIEKAMQKKPEDRYQTAAEMAADLDLILQTFSGSHLPPGGRSELARTQVASAAQSSSSWSPGRRRMLAWGLSSGMLLVVLACGLFFWNWVGGTGQTNASSGTEALGVIPTIADQAPIRVGVLHSLSGTMSGSGTPVVDSTLLAIAEINDAGGLLGRKIEAVVVDGRSDPDVFASEIRRLITEENVCVVFGCWTSSARKTVQPVVEELDHLLVYPVQYEGLETSPNIIYLGAAPNQQIIPAVEWAATTLGRKKMFIVGSDYVFPRVAGQIIRDYADKFGAEIVGEDYVALGSRNLTPVVDHIIASKADVILNLINGDSNEVFFRRLREAGISSTAIPTISFSIGEAELMKMNLRDVQGDYAAWNYFQSLPNTENKAFVKKLHERYGPQRVVTDPMEAAYVGVKLWAEGVREVGSIETKQVRRSMLNQRMIAPEGPVRLDASTQHLYKTPRVGKITDHGQFEVVWSAKEPVKPDPFPPSRKATEWQGYLVDLYRGWGDSWSAKPAAE